MLESILYYLLNTLLMIHGAVLSAALAGVSLNRSHLRGLLIPILASGAAQVIMYITFGDLVVRQLYPLIAHLPVLVYLCTRHRKRISTTVAALCCSYLCCQPAKWFGLLAYTITSDTAVQHLVHIVTLVIVFAVVLQQVVPYLSDLYNRDIRTCIIFGCVPMIYYVFDYTMNIYTQFWSETHPTAIEFLPFFLCIVHLVFCNIYYQQFEQREAAQNKEQIIRITLEQQAKEIETVKQRELELRMLRHDMRLLLNSLALSIEQNDKETSLKLISGHVSQIDATSIHRFCRNDIINYILSSYDAKCKSQHITLTATVELEELTVDETMFASILSNALDNALNAQQELPPERRSIKVILKTDQDKLLLSVKNTVKTVPVFRDGLPQTRRSDHGYGTQSIRYLTEKLGGNCHFAVQDQIFITRVVI